jgi:hypothetical protein
MNKKRRAMSVMLASLPLLAMDASAQAGAMTKMGGVLAKVLGKPVVALKAAQLTAALSSGAMKQIEHLPEDSPVLSVASYYTLLNDKQFKDANTFLVSPPKDYEKFAASIESVKVLVLNEKARTADNATVHVLLSVKSHNPEPVMMGAGINLKWVDSHWLIASAKYVKVPPPAAKEADKASAKAAEAAKK